MDMTLSRDEKRADGIFGTIINEGGVTIARTLEHSYPQEDGSFAAKIPQGIFTCRRRVSPHFGYELFEVLNVPNCTMIEIHRGNFNRDSEGCILLGESIAAHGSEEMITNSKQAFEDFMQMQEGSDHFTLTVIS